VDRLTAEDPLLDPTKSSTTNVIYETDRQNISIWHRIVLPDGPKRWQQDKLNVDENGNILNGGKIRSEPIAAGQALEYGMLSNRTDPNATNFPDDRFFTKIAIIGVSVLSPGAAGWSDDIAFVTGGTFASCSLTAKFPVAVAVQVGVSPPTITKGKLPTFVGPVITAGAAAFRTDHRSPNEIDVLPLNPGHDYYWAAVLIDKSGSWQVFTDKGGAATALRTKLRRIIIHAHSIKAVDDGDDWPSGTSEFNSDVSVVTNGKESPFFHYGENNFDTDHFYAIKHIKVIGPSAGNYDDIIRIDAIGRDQDNETGVGSYTLPRGTAAENIRLHGNAGFEIGRGEWTKTTNLKLSAGPISGSVAFDINFNVTVEYI
jgi:hypothetical protein